MKVQIELPELEGYSYTGEFRVPNHGEYYLNAVGLCEALVNDYSKYTASRHILRKVEKPSELDKVIDDWGKTHTSPETVFRIIAKEIKALKEAVNK